MPTRVIDLLNLHVNSFSPIRSEIYVLDTCNSPLQVALVDMLTSMGISADGIVGHSVGELGCAYADGSLTARETILAAYWRGYCIQTAKLPPGGMAAVGKYDNKTHYLQVSSSDNLFK